MSGTESQDESIKQNAEVPSIGIVSVYPEFSGVGIGARQYFSCLRDIEGLGHITFYQVIERQMRVSRNQNLTVWKGINMPFSALRVPLNRIILLPRKLERVPENILILTDPTISFHRRSRKFIIVIVHDLRPLTQFEKRLGEKLYFKFILKRLRYCNIIISRSNKTKSELLNFGLGEKVQSVIYPFSMLESDPGHIDRSVERIRKSSMNLTYIANDIPYKNIAFFLRLSKALEMKFEGIDLKFNLVTGNLRRESIRLIRTLNIKNLNHYSNLSDDEYVEIYKNTDVLLFPSLYEGFGLPMVEAMSQGIPIVANDIDITNEIIGDKKLLCGVNNLDEWISMVESLMKPENYSRLAHESFERGKLFSKSRFKEGLTVLMSEVIRKFNGQS